MALLPCGLPWWLSDKESICLSVQEIQRHRFKYPGEGNGNPLLYSCLENPMDRVIWQATVHGVIESQTPLSD